MTILIDNNHRIAPGVRVERMPHGDARFVFLYNEMLERMVQTSLAHPDMRLRLANDWPEDNTDVNRMIDRVCELRRSGLDEGASVGIVDGRQIDGTGLGFGRDHFFYHCVVVRGDGRHETRAESYGEEEAATKTPSSKPVLESELTRKGFEFL